MANIPFLGKYEGLLRKRTSDYAIIDNRERARGSAVALVTKVQLKELVRSIPTEIYDELQKDGSLKIEKGKVIVMSVTEEHKFKIKQEFGIDYVGEDTDVVDTYKLLKAGVKVVYNGGDCREEKCWE